MKEAEAITGGESKANDGVDWKVLNNLSHMKEAASIQE
jgi:hypothetical protein